MRLMNFPMDGHACPLKFGSCEFVLFVFLSVLSLAVWQMVSLSNDHSVTEQLNDWVIWQHIFKDFNLMCHVQLAYILGSVKLKIFAILHWIRVKYTGDSANNNKKRQSEMKVKFLNYFPWAITLVICFCLLIIVASKLLFPRNMLVLLF